MCGIFGVANHPDAANLTYLGIHQLQHRAKESAGIAALRNGHISLERGMGLVGEVFDQERLDRLAGSCAIGHLRYSTAGQSRIENAQPLLAETRFGEVAVAHNGNLVNARELRESLRDEGVNFQSDVDTEVILHLLSRSETEDFAEAVAEALSQVEGAYSLLFLHRGCVIAARDPRGFRPLCLGQLSDGGLLFSSETCAFNLVGGEFLRELEPGELLVVSGLEQPETVQLTVPEGSRPQSCVFEPVYVSRPDSKIFGHGVHESRLAMGRRLAQEHPVEADIVVPVPDSGRSVAHGFADELGIPYDDLGIIRSHFTGRTFIEPEQSVRNFGVRLKFSPNRQVLDGKRVVLVDDSIVRGTTSRKVIEMVRAAGAREVHFRAGCPPYISPCYYGVDTPTRGELIGSRLDIEGIRREIEADSLGFLTLESLLDAVGSTGDFCTSCFTGDYPTQIPQN